MMVILSQKEILVKADCFENMITNVTYTASSTKTNYPPSDAVIDNDGAWCTDEIPPNQYLDVNLGHLYDVCGVKIQGYADGTVNSYPSKYKLVFSSKENVWSVPTQEFVTNSTDANDTIQNQLVETRAVSGVRFQPTQVNGSSMCLRVAVYGTPAFNVSCDAFWMNVTISKHTLGSDLHELYINQRIDECTHAINPDEDVSLHLKTGACGMRVSQRGNYLHYQNTVHGEAGRNAQGVKITFTHDISFDATCIYERNATLKADIETINNFKLPTTSKEYGSLDFKMRAFRDSDHSEKLVSNAEPLAIGSMLYIEVEVLSADKDLQLLLERCWATASSVPTDVNQRQFVLDGCPDTDSDNRTAHSCQKSSLQKFEFAVFRFKVSDVVFVHCDVFVCLAGVQNSSCFDKCAACDDKSGRKRRSIEDENYDKGSMPHYLRIGPWQIEEEGKDASADTTTKDDSTDYMTIVLAVTGFVAVALLVAVTAVIVIHMRRMASPTEHSKILRQGSPRKERNISM